MKQKTISKATTFYIDLPPIFGYDGSDFQKLISNYQKLGWFGEDKK